MCFRPCSTFTRMRASRFSVARPRDWRAQSRPSRSIYFVRFSWTEASTRRLGLMISVRHDTIPNQNTVDEIGLKHPVLPAVLVGCNWSIALRVDGFSREAFNLVEAHSLSNTCRRSGLPLPNVDRNTVEVVHLDRSGTRCSPV